MNKSLEILRLRSALKRIEDGLAPKQDNTMCLSWARDLARDALDGCEGECYPGECVCNRNCDGKKKGKG